MSILVLASFGHGPFAAMKPMTAPPWTVPLKAFLRPSMLLYTELHSRGRGARTSGSAPRNACIAAMRALNSRDSASVTPWMRSGLMGSRRDLEASSARTPPAAIHHQAGPVLAVWRGAPDAPGDKKH
jgi:hypothetical protein